MADAGSQRISRIERRVLLGPGWLRRAAAKRAREPEERWMLAQGREVRESYVREVLDSGGDQELRRQIWMLAQPDSVRRSYSSEVLEPDL